MYVCVCRQMYVCVGRCVYVRERENMCNVVGMREY